MTPAARVQAAIDVLDQVLAGMAAERALTGWARRSRYAGSKDRAAVRDHVFDALRCLRSCAARGGDMTGRAVMIGLLRGAGIAPDSVFGTGGHAPAALTEREREAGRAPDAGGEAMDLPDWLVPLFEDSLGAQAEATAQALKSRAPVHLRVNAARLSRADAIAALLSEGIVAHAHPSAPTALEVTEGARKLRGSGAYLSGLVELQDAASQAIVAGLPLRDGMRVLDYCAGGGGKALAMAARCDIDLFVHDADPARMRDLPARATRAGVSVTPVSPDEIATAGRFDLVLCDVPCSGSGSWRRAPHGKWTLTRERLGQLCTTQAQILRAVSPLVKDSGYLVYATCSLLTCENADQVDHFCSETGAWMQVFSQSWMLGEGTDGFFAAHLTRLMP